MYYEYNKLLSDGVCSWLYLVPSLVGRILSCGELLANIFLLLYEKPRCVLFITH